MEYEINETQKYGKIEIPHKNLTKCWNIECYRYQIKMKDIRKKYTIQAKSQALIRVVYKKESFKSRRKFDNKPLKFPWKPLCWKSLLSNNSNVDYKNTQLPYD